MGNIYINKTEQGTWDCSIGESGNGVLLVKEKGYPVELPRTSPRAIQPAAARPPARMITRPRRT